MADTKEVPADSEANGDVPDETTGLTGKQKDAIRKSWDLVRPTHKQMQQHGVEFFIAFFIANLGYQDKFAKLKGLSIEELRTSGKMRAHATLVMTNLSAIVDNLDDGECLVTLLQKIGGDHHPRGVTPQHFENLTPVFMAFMAEKLGEHFDDFTKDSWKSAFKVVNAVITEANLARAKEDK